MPIATAIMIILIGLCMFLRAVSQASELLLKALGRLGGPRK
jgi:hypothetical protein